MTLDPPWCHVRFRREEPPLCQAGLGSSRPVCDRGVVVARVRNRRQGTTFEVGDECHHPEDLTDEVGERLGIVRAE